MLKINHPFNKIYGCRNGMIDLSLSNKDPILADRVQE